MLKLFSEAALLAYWKSGMSAGLTDSQRKCYMNELEKLM